MFKTVMSNLMTQIVPICDCLSAETISYSDNKSKNKKMVFTLLIYHYVNSVLQNILTWKKALYSTVLSFHEK